MLRAQKHGVMVQTVVDSLYFHPVNRSIQYRKVGRYSVPVKEEPIWKAYCDARNSVYITREYFSTKMLLIHIFILCSSCWFVSCKKGLYFKYKLLGIIDGLRCDFSRRIMFDK